MSKLNDEAISQVFWDETPLAEEEVYHDGEGDDDFDDDAWDEEQASDAAQSEEPETDAETESLVSPVVETAVVPEPWPRAEEIEEAIADDVTTQPEALAPGQADPDEPDDEEDATVNMDDVLALVDGAMAEADKPIELTSDQLAKGKEVAAQTAVLELFISGKGFTRRVDARQIVSEEFREAADNKMLRSSKKLIVCDKLEAIRKCTRKFKDDMAYLKLPTNLLRGGMALIPVANVDKVEDLYRAFKLNFKQCVRAFLAVYVIEQERAHQLQGALYDPRHYPTLKEVARSFKVDHRWLAFDAPTAMQGINSAEWRSAGAKLQAQMAEACAEMQDQLRAQMAEYVEWLVSQLQTDADGKRKAITESKFADMQKFFESAAALNVAGDGELTNAIEMAKAVISGRDANEFKGKGKTRQTADQLREQTAAAFEQIKAVTDKWMVTAPSRTVYSEDDI